MATRIAKALAALSLLLTLEQGVDAQRTVRAIGAPVARASARPSVTVRHARQMIRVCAAEKHQTQHLGCAGEVLAYPMEASESTPAAAGGGNATDELTGATTFQPRLDFVLKVTSAVGVAVAPGAQTLWYLAWPGLGAEQTLLTGASTRVPRARSAAAAPHENRNSCFPPAGRRNSRCCGGRTTLQISLSFLLRACAQARRST